jgi:hypothetical protein
MSFDLYFCWQKNERVDFDAVWAWANQRGNFSRTDNQQWYENPNTGVYFSLDFDPQGSVSTDDSPIPGNYFDSGLSLNLNFNRPSFFGYEAMPYVEELANRFGLSVVDNQADVGSVLMTQPESKATPKFSKRGTLAATRWSAAQSCHSAPISYEQVQL